MVNGMKLYSWRSITEVVEKEIIALEGVYQNIIVEYGNHKLKQEQCK